MSDYINETIFNDIVLNSVNIGNSIKEISCKFDYTLFFFFFFIPIIIFISMIWTFFNWKKIKKFIEKYKLKNNYIKVKIISENKNIVTKLVLMDKYNKFSFKDRDYTLEDLQKYVIGYEKGTPFLLYDKRFIFPLVLSEYTVKLEAMSELGLTEKDLETDSKGLLKEKINALYLKVDSALLNIVYRKKLISDLYDVSKEHKIDPMIIYVAGGVIVLIVLYFSGALTPILESLGVTMGQTK